MLTRWDPFRDMISMRRMMDRLIDESLTGDGEETRVDWTLPLDVIEEEKEFIVKASLPGIKQEDIEVIYNKGALTIKGTTEQETEKKESQYHLRERRVGSFSRTVTLPVAIKDDAINAEYKDGILTLRLPKSEQDSPKRIVIKAGQNVIESKKSR
jgi:HSP20 family protein